MKNLFLIFSNIILCGFITATDLSIYGNSALPKEKISYLIDLGKVVYELLQEEPPEGPIDFVNANIFQELELDSFKNKISYSKMAKYAVISNAFRWGFSSSDENYIKERKNRLIAISGLVWYISSRANDQNELFSRGSFTIVDTNSRITKFLTDYVKLVTGSDEPENLHAALTESNFAYRRNPEAGGSSHHKGRTPNGQFGIDMRFEPWETIMKILPFEMAHILFGDLDLGQPQEEKLLFLKFEPVGFGGIGEFIDHSSHFLHSNNLAGTERREKDINNILLEGFHNIASLAELEIEDKKLIVRDICIKVEYLFTESEDDNIIEACNKLLEEINYFYPNGFHEYRTGNEVIIKL